MSKQYSSSLYDLNHNSKSKKIFIIHYIIILIFITYIFYIFNNKISVLSCELDDMKFIISFVMQVLEGGCKVPHQSIYSNEVREQLYRKYPYILTQLNIPRIKL